MVTFFFYACLSAPFTPDQITVGMKSTNRRMKAARVLAGLRQADLAAKIGKSPSWICDLERGLLAPSDLEASIISRVLRVDANYLFPQTEAARAVRTQELCDLEDRVGKVS